MSNRTRTPGISNDDNLTNVNMGGRKTSSRQGPASGTWIEGMGVASGANAPEQEQPGGHPIVGFLVSVSRTNEGEYWVLRQGQNLIGSDNNCNIFLNEAGVSNKHALLAIQRNPGDNNRLIVGLFDQGSANGTFVNGNIIGFSAYQCKNFDKIKIGNYELLLMLFDHADHDMKKSDVFMPKADNDYDNENYYSGSDRTRM